MELVGRVLRRGGARLSPSSSGRHSSPSTAERAGCVLVFFINFLGVVGLRFGHVLWVHHLMLTRMLLILLTARLLLGRGLVLAFAHRFLTFGLAHRLLRDALLPPGRLLLGRFGRLEGLGGTGRVGLRNGVSGAVSSVRGDVCM